MFEIGREIEIGKVIEKVYCSRGRRAEVWTGLDYPGGYIQHNRHFILVDLTTNVNKSS